MRPQDHSCQQIARRGRAYGLLPVGEAHLQFIELGAARRWEAANAGAGVIRSKGIPGGVTAAGVMALLLLTSCEDGVTSPSDLGGEWRLESLRDPLTKQRRIPDARVLGDAAQLGSLIRIEANRDLSA